MKLMVTGSKGWIGSKLHAKVGGIGIDVRDGMNLLTCELPDDVDTIYHLASQSDVEVSWHDPLHDLDNIRITARLVHKYPNAKLIYTNSAAALDQSSPYGFSKWAAGEYIKRFHNRFVLCTLPNVYGKGSRSVVDKFLGKKRVQVYGNGEHTRSYVHVDDIVEALVKAKDWACGDYHLGNGIATSVLELAKGKKVTFLEERKEAEESVLINTTPDWQPTVKLSNYLL